MLVHSYKCLPECKLHETMTKATTYQHKVPCASFQLISMPTSTPTRNNHSSYFSQHRLILPILDLHINGITQCVIFMCLASFAQHVFEIHPCFFEYQCFISFYCPVILHCMHILIRQLVHSLQSYLTSFFLSYLKSAPLAIAVVQSSNTTWIWSLLPHANQLVPAIISSFLISLFASCSSVYLRVIILNNISDHITDF